MAFLITLLDPQTTLTWPESVLIAGTVVIAAGLLVEAIIARWRS